MYMMTRNAIMKIPPLIICVLVMPAQTTVLKQDTVIEFLLKKVSELETNQQECGIYQNKMLLELTYVKQKLEQSERRISELEAIVYDMGYHEYTENLSVTMENDTVDKPTNKTVTKVIIEENNIRRAAEPKKRYSHQPGILKREGLGIATKHIAFYATIINGVVPVHPYETIHFDTVLHNEGNGFNRQTGTFTCPLSGTYFFTVSLLVQPGSATYVHLIVNGNIKANSFADGKNSWDQGSVLSIVRCEAGQNVWISVNGGTSIYGEYYTSFSGIFLWGDAIGSR